MGRIYDLPPNTNDKEKVIGGVFTFTQFIFLVIGFLTGGGVALLFKQVFTSYWFAVVGFALGIVPFLPFGFYRVEKMGDIELFRYLVIKFQFRHSHKKYINENINFSNGGMR